MEKEPLYRSDKENWTPAQWEHYRRTMRQAAYARRLRAQDADRCQECKRILPPDEAAYRVQSKQWGLLLVWVCCDCVRKNHPELLDCDIPPADVCRVCDRELYVLEEVAISDWTNPLGNFHEESKPHDHDRFTRYCSDGCRLKIIARERRDARHEGLAERECASPDCHKMIKLDDRRTDARYCKATCRTHALRKKRRDERRAIPQAIRQRLEADSRVRGREERAAQERAEARRKAGFTDKDEFEERRTLERAEAKREVQEKYPQLHFRH